MKSFVIGLVAAATSATVSPLAAQAQWLRAETPHFVIFSEESKSNLETFARELELFDASYRSARGTPDRELAEGNKLRVYVVHRVSDVQEAMGVQGGVAGFYRPNISGSIAVVPRVAGGNDVRSLNPEVIFFHEYTHHLMFETLYSSMPAWLREGYAEFFSTADVDVRGSAVSLGRPAQHRAMELQYLKPMPMDEMLSDDIDYRDFRHVSSIYAWGWVLTHYLTFDKDREGQLNDYILRLTRGEEALDAARSAFGDLDKLSGEMRAYREQLRMPYVKLDVPRLPDSAVNITNFSAGMNEAMPYFMRSQFGVSSEKQAREVLRNIREVARKHPKDAMLQRALTEALFDVHDFDAAEDAAKRALELDPGMIDAHLYLARIAMARVNPPDSWEKIERDMEEAKKKAEAKRKGDKYVEPDEDEEEKPDLEPAARAAYFAEAREHIQAARKLAPKDPEPLWMFYESFTEEGVDPPMAAIRDLIAAVQLAPFDKEARFEAAKALLANNNAKDAEILLSAIAYDTHGRGQAKAARAMIDLIREGKAKSALSIDPEDYSDDEDEDESDA